MEFIKIKSDKLVIFFLSMMPLALAAGPAVIETFSFLILISFFLLKKKFLFEKKEYLILILFFFLILSSLISEFKIHSIQSSFFLLRVILLFYVFKFFFKYYKDEIIEKTLFFLIITFGILVFDVLFQYTFNHSFFGTEKISDGRMSIHFREESIIGAYLSRTLPIFIGLWLYKFKIFKIQTNLLFFFISLLVLISTLLSNERAAGVLLVSFILMIFSLSNLNSVTKILLIFIFSFFVGFMIYANKDLNQRFIKETFQELYGQNDANFVNPDNKISEDIKIEEFLKEKNKSKIFLFSTAHEAHIRTAFNMFQNNFVFGVGPNNFRNLCSKDRYGIYPERGCSTHPHHILSQILAETGITGFIFYLITISFISINLLRHFFLKNLNYSKVCMYSFYFLLLIPLLPSGNIFSNWYLYSILLPFFYLNFIR